LLRKQRKTLGVHFFLPHPVQWPRSIPLVRSDYARSPRVLVRVRYCGRSWLAYAIS